MRIALDAMGGDYAPKNTVAGAVMALREYPRITKLFLTGDEQAIKAELATLGCTDPRIEIVHTTQVVEMSDAAVEAVRRKKDSSVSRAVDLVKAGQADAIVSAGHTGAAVAATTIKLRTLEGIERPGIASYIPPRRMSASSSTPGPTSTPSPFTYCSTRSWDPSSPSMSLVMRTPRSASCRSAARM